ncbi:unnamed protein product, partial [Urochloa humidicola]
ALHHESDGSAARLGFLALQSAIPSACSAPQPLGSAAYSSSPPFSARRPLCRVCLASAAAASPFPFSKHTSSDPPPRRADGLVGTLCLGAAQHHHRGARRRGPVVVVGAPGLLEADFSAGTRWRRCSGVVEGAELLRSRASREDRELQREGVEARGAPVRCV